MEDTKAYVVLTDGTYALPRSEWEGDTNKTSKFTDGTVLKIFTSGSYENGCDYAFTCAGHWYMF